MDEEQTLTREQVRQFLHHLHIIPVSKGLTEKWMLQNAPGWTTARLVVALQEEGAIERVDPNDDGGHFSGWQLVEDLTEVSVHP